MTDHTSKLLSAAILWAANGLRSGMLESRLCTCGEVRHDGPCVVVLRENRNVEQAKNPAQKVR